MKHINKNTIYIAAITLVIGLLMGWLFFGNAKESISEKQNIEQTKNQIWTCSMHPQIRQSEPGQCPICGMDLIPLNNESSSDENPMEVKMSPTAMQLANVQTMIITKQKPVKQVRMNGKVKADETKVYSQSSHIPGRIEKLMVSFTGEPVQQGQTLAHVYSPELVTAQEELFEAYKIKDNQPALYQAAREKLKNWKLTEKQINQVLEKGEIQEQFPILADVSGIVLNKKVNLGDYITKGQSIYEIANLNNVWVLFDVYESDISWVKLSDKVTFTVPSIPGENFTGNVSFIDPVINSKTRVASARVEMNNPGMRLKPDMFVQGIIESPIQKQEKALVVPKSAVMWTGERSVVYIKNTSAKGVSFMMRQVTLGAALGDSYIIKKGVEEGEEIAVNGTFSIDAAAQLAGKPSMMSPEGGKAGGSMPGMPGMPGMKMNDGSASKGTQKSTEKFIEGKAYDFRDQVPDVLRKQLDAVIEAYLNLKNGLVQTDEKATAKYSSSLLDAIQQVDGSLLKGDAKAFWEEKKSFLIQHARLCKEASTIAGKRKNFIYLSQPLIKLVEAFGPGDEKLYVDYCPMANDNKGAFWLSETKEIRNPFMVEAMRTCGEVKQEIK